MTRRDIAYLRKKDVFCEELLEYLAASASPANMGCPGGNAPPGSPSSPSVPAIEAQFIETYLLLNLNHQSLIATKSNRIVRAAQGRPVSEFGSRRAADGSLLSTRASYIAGCAGACLHPGRQLALALPPG